MWSAVRAVAVSSCRLKRKVTASVYQLTGGLPSSSNIQTTCLTTALSVVTTNKQTLRAAVAILAETNLTLAVVLHLGHADIDPQHRQH